MKLFTLGALMAIAAGAAGAHDFDFDQRSSFDQRSTSQQTLHFAAGSSPRSLEVRTITGAITVEAYDGQDVEVIVNKTAYGRSRDEMETANRQVKLETTDNGGTVKLIVRFPDNTVCGEKDIHWHNEYGYNVRYDFTIRVPKDTRLELCSINRGDIDVSGTRADYSIHTINGRITMADVGGSGEATTINGRVTAAFAVAPRDASTFKTINGDVVLEMH